MDTPAVHGHPRLRWCFVASPQAASLLSRFARASERLASVLSEDEVVGVILEETLPLVGAAAGVVGLTRGENVEVVGAIGYPEGRIEPWRSFPVSARLPMSDVIRGRKPVFCRSAEERDRRWPVDWKADLNGTHALVVLPLIGRMEVLGAIALSFGDDRSFSTAERSLLSAIASQCALALERARLYAAEQRASERAYRLQRFTERLAPALTTVDVVDISLDKLLVAAHARGAMFAVLSEPERKLTNVRSAGLPHRLTRMLDEAAGRHQTALNDAFGRKIPIWIKDREEWESVYPASAEIFKGFARSLAVLPLIKGADVFGAMEVLFEGESEFAPDERRFLLAIASQAAQALDRAHAYEEQRHIALALQQRLLPRTLPKIAGADLAAVYRPAARSAEVGGDFYDAFETPTGWVLVIGDVCGKGVEAAAFTSQCRNSLRVAALGVPKPMPGELLRLLNRSLVSTELEFASVACATVERSECGLRATFASAGHPPILVRRTGGLVEAINPLGPLVGIFDDTDFAEQSIELAEGDILFMYTDGVTEARAHGRILGESRLQEAIAFLPDGSRPEAVLGRIEKLLVDFQEDGRASDDVAMLAVAVRRTARDTAETGHSGERASWTETTGNDRVAPLMLLFPPKPTQLSHVRDAVDRWLKPLPIPGDRAAEIILALNEAAANAIEHAYRGFTEPRAVSIEASISGAELVAVIADRGIWRPRRSRLDSGRGFILMRALSDGVDLQHDIGTRVCLRWYLDAEQANRSGQPTAC